MNAALEPGLDMAKRLLKCQVVRDEDDQFKVAQTRDEHKPLTWTYVLGGSDLAVAMALVLVWYYLVVQMGKEDTAIEVQRYDSIFLLLSPRTWCYCVVVTEELTTRGVPRLSTLFRVFSWDRNLGPYHATRFCFLGTENLHCPVHGSRSEVSPIFVGHIGSAENYPLSSSLVKGEPPNMQYTHILAKLPPTLQRALGIQMYLPSAWVWYIA
ncbi:LADA_0D07514g1_1 [Lachancea dasiensis]|uniref:LADA_0D07514g1_1 n=1 Tax=Lachancea dasiensis TaxID=1072105 RepID=A0A1G4J6F5_9SACH|nr:LADA_0D07514g1_1 [Lachancea dasiensis]